MPLILWLIYLIVEQIFATELCTMHVALNLYVSSDIIKSTYNATVHVCLRDLSFRYIIFELAHILAVLS